MEPVGSGVSIIVCCSRFSWGQMVCVTRLSPCRLLQSASSGTGPPGLRRVHLDWRRQSSQQTYSLQFFVFKNYLFLASCDTRRHFFLQRASARSASRRAAETRPHEACCVERSALRLLGRPRRSRQLLQPPVRRPLRLHREFRRLAAHRAPHALGFTTYTFRNASPHFRLLPSDGQGAYV